MSESENLPPKPASQSKSIVSGIGWNLIAVLGEQASSLVAFVLIARILGPADFGTVILSVALIDVFITFVRSGISEALIRAPEMNETLLGTAFWLNMSIAIIIALGIYVFAPFYGNMLDLPATVPLLQTMTFAFPIAATGAIAEALLARKMAFAAIARRQVLGSLAGTATAIGLAYSGYGVWAMIFQRLMIFTVGAALAVWATKLVPPLRFSRSAAREIAQFSGGITSINVLYRLQPRAAELVIGVLAQPTAVALFRAAYRIVDLINQLPMQPVMRVIFPTLSRLTKEPERFKAVLKQFMEGLQTILIPLYVGAGYFSSDIFHTLFGSKWDGAVPAFIILLTAAGLRITFALIGPSASARGAVKRSASFTVMDVTLSIAVMTLVAPWGIETIACSRVAVAFLLWPIAYYTLMKPMGLSFGDILGSLKNPLLISALLLASLMIIAEVFNYFQIPLNFLVEVLISGILYAGLIVAVSRRGLAELMAACGMKPSRFIPGFAKKVEPK